MRTPAMLKKIGISVKAVIFNGSDILILQKNDRQNHYPWEFPGGGLEFGESFREGLEREVREETGLAVEVLGPLGSWEYRRERNYHLNGMLFACRTTERTVRLSAEHRGYRWIRPAELAVYPLQESLRNALAELDADGLQEAAECAAYLTEERR